MEDEKEEEEEGEANCNLVTDGLLRDNDMLLCVVDQHESEPAVSNVRLAHLNTIVIIMVTNLYTLSTRVITILIITTHILINSSS